MGEKFSVGDVVCFRENHKWIGSLGFVEEVKPIAGENGEATLRIMVGVPAPLEGIAYIFCLPHEIEVVGKYPYVVGKGENDE